MMVPHNSPVYIIQCAWCRRVQDASGNYTIASEHMILAPGASHGICAACSIVVFNANPSPDQA